MTSRTTIAVLAALLAACSSSDGPASLPPGLDEARLSSAEARARGRNLYLQHCSLCHGEHGDGRGLRQLAFARPPRDFTDATWRRSVTPGQVYARIREGVPGTPMASWRSLGDEAVADITAYVLSLRR
jgi:mono/diheme cytochrome c family protein